MAVMAWRAGDGCLSSRVYQAVSASLNLYTVLADRLVAVGLLVFVFMPSYPEKAGWLSPEEKELQARRLGPYRSSG